MSSLSSSLLFSSHSSSFPNPKRPRNSTQHPHPHSYLYPNPLPVNPISNLPYSSSASEPPSTSSLKPKSLPQTSKPPRKKRTTPCERCRRIRKGCDFSIPCKRCSNANSECIYISVRSRAEKDHEGVVIYEEVFDHVEDVQLGIEEMEKEVETMRKIVPNKDPSGFLPFSDLSGDDVSRPWARDDDRSLSPEPYHDDDNVDSFAFFNLKFKKGSIFTSADPRIPLEDAVVPFNISWQSRPVKEGFRVKTNISTLEGFMAFLTATAVEYIPHESKHLTPDLLLLSPGKLWQQFNWFFKTRLFIEGRSPSVRRLILPDKTSFPTPYLLPPDPRQDSQDDVRRVTLHLLDAFFRCMNTNFPLMHEQTFYERYVDRLKPTCSAIVCALSAWMVTRYCSHVFPAPEWDMTPKARKSWGEYYFEQAEDKNADIFDEPCYDNFLYQLFMAQYRMGSRMYPKAEAHVEHAYRIREFLALNYKKKPLKDQIEGETFKRLAVYFIGVQRALVLIVGNGRFDCVNDICAVMDVFKLLPGEDPSIEKWIKLMNHMFLLEDILCGIQMRAGIIPVDDFVRLEKLLRNWWAKNPSSLKPNNSSEFAPQYAAPLSRDEILSAQICMNYHSCWMLMHSRLLPDKNSTSKFLPPSNATFEECSGPKGKSSIEICMNSARIVTLLAEQVEHYSPCDFDYHALSQAYEVHVRLAQLDPLDKDTEHFRDRSKELKDRIFIDVDCDRTERKLVIDGEMPMGFGWIVGGADNWWEAVK